MKSYTDAISCPAKYRANRSNTFRYRSLFRNLSSYFIRIISSLSRENYFSISEKYYKPNLVDIIFRFEKLSLKIFYFGNSLVSIFFFLKI